MFSPEEEYQINQEKVELRDIREYPDKFILRPPYQRHAGVWKTRMKEQLLDSICRRYYIPRIVLRRIRFDGKTEKWEVIDGQQRLCTILDFFNPKDNLKLPDSLKDLAPDIVGKKYSELDSEKRKWFDKLYINADVILGIQDKDNPEHQKIASDLFFLLQQSEPLSFIEVLHSKLNSNIRRFVSEYADTQSFDFKNYEPLDTNQKLHPFFEHIIDMTNERMEYLLLLARFLMVEFTDGCVDVGDKSIKSFFNKHPAKNTDNRIDGDFESKQEVKNCLTNLNALYNVFKSNPMLDDKHGVKYIKKDYFILSLYILLRHLRKYYVFTEAEYEIFDKFAEKFYIRLMKNDENDKEVMWFRDNRQQSKENLEARDRIIRMLFFKDNPKLLIKDTKRFANEAEKIEIYSRDSGICKICLDDFKKQGLPDEQAEENSKVSWKDFEADHILAYIRGGRTSTEEMQVLCKHHNRQKQDRIGQVAADS